MTVRLSIAAAVLLAIYGAVFMVQSRGIPASCAPAEMNLEDLPLTLGEWKGRVAAAIDPEVFNKLDALVAFDRVYSDNQGRNVSFHTALFDSSFHLNLSSLTTFVHPPEWCYPGSGWQITDNKIVSLDKVGASGNLARLLTVERKGETAYVLYWYQIDGHAYCSGERQKELMLAWRGRPERSPIIKVMLQTSAANADDAEKIFTSIAGEAFKWTWSFH